MAKRIPIRNGPEELHRRLEARAALQGISLSESLLAESRRSAERPTLQELRKRLSQRSPVLPEEPPAEAVRAERDRS